MLKEGQKAPAFSLKSADGKSIRLSDFKGKKLVVYFYPKDDTPGCTKEACGFRDSYSEFQKRDINIIGISADSIESHKKFEEKYKLPFILLSDEKKTVLKKYGVWGKKKFMGREYMGIKRTTFLIDEKGKISKIFYNVNPLNHDKEILKSWS